MYQTTPGDGNAGTMIYSIKRDDAVNPEKSINVFESGMHVKSNRTARLQASADGNFIYNIQYTGADGGVFNKYQVKGGKNFEEIGASLSTAEYVGTSPRWAKAKEGIGIAVNVKDIKNNFLNNDSKSEFLGVTATAVVLAIDLENPRIMAQKEFELVLSPEEQKAGYHIFRLDAPVLNTRGDKLYIGTWLRKYTPGTTNAETNYTRLATKTLVLDYPSLANPKIISSTQATGDNSGYRSPMSYATENGTIYQATHRENAGTGGSKILKINTDGILKINCFFAKYKSDGTSDANLLQKHFCLSILMIILTS